MPWYLRGHTRLRFVEGGEGGGAPAGGNGGDAEKPDGDKAGADKSGDEFKSEHSKKTVLADLAAAREEARQAKEALAELENKNKTAEQREADERKQRDENAARDARKVAQYDAAAEVGLPLSWAQRIFGDTAEEMLADAKKLKADMDANASASHSTDGAGKTGGDDPAANAQPGAGRLSAYYAANSK